MATIAASDELAELVKQTIGTLDGILERFDWADEEIALASTRHPAAADLLHHSFSLLNATTEMMTIERVFRSHARELLDRVAAGEDTRVPTAAEICCLCSSISKITPMRSSAAGLYFRYWPKAYPGLPNPAANVQLHREVLDGSKIDALEEDVRRKLTVADRQLGDVECRGRHHCIRVRCRFASS